MKNILEIKKTTHGNILPDSNVKFNEASPYSDGISYDPATDEILLPEAGQYFISWWVATKSALTGCIKFALKSSQGDIVMGCSPTKEGQVTGFANIYADSPEVTLSLVNMGDCPVILSMTVPVTSALSVIKIPDDSAKPVTTVIPFGLGKYGVSLSTDTAGEPLMVVFSGFSSGYYDMPTYLLEGEWATGTITIREDMEYGLSFIMPCDGTLRKLHVLFSKEEGYFEEGAIIRPFVCIAVSESDSLVYTILQDSLTFTAPYAGDTDYPRHTVRRGVSNALDIPIAEGTLVGIVVGIMAEGAVYEQSGRFAVSGGISLE